MKIIFRRFWNAYKLWSKSWSDYWSHDKNDKTNRKRINQKADNWLCHHIQNRQQWCNISHNIRRNAQLLSKHVDLRQNGSHSWKVFWNVRNNYRSPEKTVHSTLTCHKEKKVRLDGQQTVANACHCTLVCLEMRFNCFCLTTCSVFFNSLFIAIRSPNR